MQDFGKSLKINKNYKIIILKKFKNIASLFLYNFIKRVWSGQIRNVREEPAHIQGKDIKKITLIRETSSNLSNPSTTLPKTSVNLYSWNRSRWLVAVLRIRIRTFLSDPTKNVIE